MTPLLFYEFWHQCDWCLGNFNSPKRHADKLSCGCIICGDWCQKKHDKLAHKKKRKAVRA